MLSLNEELRWLFNNSKQGFQSQSDINEPTVADGKQPPKRM